MRDLLRQPLDGYLGLDTKDKKFKFRPPFKPILHRWLRIQSLLSAETHKPLIYVLSRTIGSDLALITKAQETGMCDFDSLWLVFEDGDEYEDEYEDKDENESDQSEGVKPRSRPVIAQEPDAEARKEDFVSMTKALFHDTMKPPL